MGHTNGVPPKNPRTRRRGPGPGGILTLTAAAKTGKMPPLPKRPDGEKWSKLAQDHWKTIWRSDMASEFADSDLERLYVYIDCYDRWWTAESDTQRQKYMAEVRLQGIFFGLTPLDRRRLQWEIDRGDEAQVKTRKRKNEQKPKAVTGDDPRAALA